MTKFALATILTIGALPAQSLEELRNLGKAFYENPTTQKEAAETLKRALDASPNSTRERLNYGLALLRAGRNAEAVSELLAVQKVSPEIPHTWFTLGIEFKKQGEPEKALEQMQGAARLDPRESIIRYNLGVLLKQLGRSEEAQREFEAARDLNQGLAAARFQLFNSYRQAGRQDDAQRELAEFQRLKKESEGAAIPEDVDWSQYSEIYDPRPPRPPADSTPLRFAERALPFAATGAMGFGSRLLTWDAQTLRLNGLVIARVAGVLSATAGDFNNDGRMDLCVTTPSGAKVLENRAAGWRLLPGIAGEGRFARCVWLDYDHDYDLDLILIGEDARLLRNQGPAGFADRTADFPFASALALDAVPFRKTADTRGFDLVVSYANRPAVLYRDLLMGKYAAEEYSAIPAGARYLLAGDFNGDGELEVSAGTSERVFADLRNSGQPELVDAAAALDRNADGKLDLISRGAKGWIERINTTATANMAVRLEIVGVKNLKTSPGAEVEVKIGGLYQKHRYEGFPLHVGLGRAKTIDVVRITWPNGLIQNEMRQAAGRLLIYREAQRLSGSCPIVWAWNGEAFEYVTDVLGVAPLGASAGDGTFFPTDRDEYISLRGEQLRPNAEGRLEVRLTEELSEAAYFDRIRLLALDHPSTVEIFTNEKWKGPPFPEFRLYGVTKRVPAMSATDGNGRDVTTNVAKRDRSYADTFARTSAGVAENHTLTLDFGAAAPGNDAILVLHGWVDWADGSTFLAQAQAGQPLQPPSLQVKDKAGNWVTVIDDMGMPSGKPKTIVVDLSGRFLSASRKLRIVTNLCVYWDEIFLGETSAPPAQRLRELPLAAARLRFRGFSPSRIHPERKQPEEFFYPEPSPTSLWDPTPGLYTNYGDVTALLRDADDKLAVMGSGDETQLEFESSVLPVPPNGWRRDFLLHVEGWAKDRDANTAHSQTVGPLPFRSMSAYPYNRDKEIPPSELQQERQNRRPALRLLRSLSR